jgi:hypothetical protein
MKKKQKQTRAEKNRNTKRAEGSLSLSLSHTSVVILDPCLLLLWRWLLSVEKDDGVSLIDKACPLGRVFSYRFSTSHPRVVVHISHHPLVMVSTATTFLCLQMFDQCFCD